MAFGADPRTGPLGPNPPAPAAPGTLGEPDLLVLPALGVGQQGHEGDGEHQADRVAQGRGHRLADELEGEAQDGEDHPEDVAPLLPVGDPVARGPVGQGEGQGHAERSHQGEERLEVEEERGDLQRLGLVGVEEALRLGHGQDPPRRSTILAGGTRASGPGAPPWRVRSCPQAASMSVPRFLRTVAPTPPARSRSAKAWTRRPGLAGAPNPGVGWSGMRLPWAAGENPRSRRARASAWAGASLTPPIMAYSNDSRRPEAAR